MTRVAVTLLQGARVGALGLRTQRELRICCRLRSLPPDRGCRRMARRSRRLHQQAPSPAVGTEVRAPNAKELKGTMILAMEIEQASAKVRYRPPDDDGEDAALDVCEC